MAFRRRRSRKSDPISSRPLRVDPTAASADPTLPSFLVRPEGSPVYTGFPVIEGSEVDGFRLGMITDFEAKPGTMGDAFVVAPDNSRAGLVWGTEVDEPYCNEVGPPDAARWVSGRSGFADHCEVNETWRSICASFSPNCDPAGRHGAPVHNCQ